MSILVSCRCILRHSLKCLEFRHLEVSKKGDLPAVEVDNHLVVEGIVVDSPAEEGSPVDFRNETSLCNIDYDSNR